MPILWLRVALGCYAVGLLYALLALTRTSSLLNRVALPAMSLGMVFQFVSLTEAVLLSGQLTLTSVHNSESLLALLVMAAFMIVYLVYRTTSPGIVVFPLVFVLTFVAATTQQPFLEVSPGMRRGWLFVHIAMIFIGYAALFLSFAASLLYLLQERSLKSKKPAAILLRLPALEVIDQIGYRSLLLGLSFHDVGTDRGQHRRPGDLRAPGLSRSQDFSFAADVGGLHGDGVYPLECGLAGTPRRLSGYRRRHRGGHRLVGELLQHDSRVRPIMKFQLIGVNHKTAPVEVRERIAIPESRLPRR